MTIEITNPEMIIAIFIGITILKVSCEKKTRKKIRKSIKKLWKKISK